VKLNDIFSGLTPESIKFSIYWFFNISTIDCLRKETRE